jgi:sensor histidine kinase YesM
MTWRTFFWVWLAWTTIGALHALSQYSDIIKYGVNVEFGLSKVSFLVFSYSLWIIITLILLRFMRSFSFPFVYRSVVLLFVIGLLSWLPLYFSVDYAVSTLLSDGGLDEWLAKLVNTSNSVIFFYVLVYGLTFVFCLGLVLADKTKQEQKINANLVQKQTEFALLLAEQNMQLMQSQLSPHFLFNCMGAISGLARIGKLDTLVDAIAKVGDLLRFTVENSSCKTITLDEELTFVHNYIGLQKLRFEDRFTCEFSVSEFNSDVMCPPFTVQLLLENVFRHAVEATEEQISIHVAINQNQQNVNIHVSNTFVAISQDTTSMGIGLDNLKSRLQHIYADNFTFEVNKNTHRFDAHMSIPKELIVQ